MPKKFNTWEPATKTTVRVAAGPEKKPKKEKSKKK